MSEGNWNAHVDVRGPNEVGQLAVAFNRMTHELTEQRERLVQAERVAAWREVARRLAHELEKSALPAAVRRSKIFSVLRSTNPISSRKSSASPLGFCSRKLNT